MSSVAGKNKITREEAVVWMRTQPDMQDIVRTCYFDDPLEESAKRFYLSREWIAVQSILADVRRGTALDIGAGRGYFIVCTGAGRMESNSSRAG